jgi:hypothetical protein
MCIPSKRLISLVGNLRTVASDRPRYGGSGDSLVKGVVVKLPAIALSVKPGGSARRVAIAGGLITHGVGIMPLELNGAVDSLQVTEGLIAAGGL